MTLMNQPVEVNEGEQHVLSSKKYSSSRNRLMTLLMYVVIAESNLNSYLVPKVDRMSTNRV